MKQEFQSRHVEYFRADADKDTLPFQTEPQLSPEPQEFAGLHGVFYDSLPDGWGLLLMDLAFRQQTGWQGMKSPRWIGWPTSVHAQ